MANLGASAVTTARREVAVACLGEVAQVEAVWTGHRGHATELARAAAREGYDVVVALGGDGTAHEVANGLAGTATALAHLPGGSANVYARTLGLPARLGPAARTLRDALVGFRPRAVDLGTVDAGSGPRRFLFSSGIGLSASAVAFAERHPQVKARLRWATFAAAATGSYLRSYLWRAPRLRLDTGSASIDGRTIVVQNSELLTFLGPRPLSLTPGAGLDTGALAFAVLLRAGPLELPSVGRRLLSGNPHAVSAHPQIATLSRVASARVVSLDGRPFPVEADGEYLGPATEVRYGVAPRSLRVVP